MTAVRNQSRPSYSAREGTKAFDDQQIDVAVAVLWPDVEAICRRTGLSRSGVLAHVRSMDVEAKV